MYANYCLVLQGQCQREQKVQKYRPLICIEMNTLMCKNYACNSFFVLFNLFTKSVHSVITFEYIVDMTTERF